MTDILLQTKLNLPPTRPKTVARPQLVAQLSDGLGQAARYRKLTLVCAPAGFGKTTLVADWLRGLSNDQFAWLSLDEGDNDPNRFMTYFVAGLRGAAARGGVKEPFAETAATLLEMPQPAPPQAVIASLINEMSAVSPSAPLVFVLDDYHLIQEESVHQALAFLLEHLPPSLHLVVIGRTVPPLPLARLRGRGQVIEIGASDLRFTLPEASRFFEQTMGLALEPDVVAGLEGRTEGWVTGLQLAALALQQSETDSFPKSLSGRHQLVLDYLVDEVLHQQPPRIRQFLLQTAVLDRLCAPLCEAVTGQAHGRTTLQTLDRANLFLVPLDEERRWYRYHHLFAEFLRARLQAQLEEAQIVELQRRAAHWYRQNGYRQEAIEHALAAAEFSLAGELIMDAADALWTRGNVSLLRAWLERLPEEMLRQDATVATYYAWCLFFAGQLSPQGQRLFAKAGRTLQDVQQALENNQDRVQEAGSESSTRLPGMVLSVRAALSSVQGDVEGTVQAGEQALQLLPQESFMWRGVVAVSLATAYRKRQRLDQATATFAEAVRLNRKGGNLSGALFAAARWAELLVQQGQLPEAGRVYEEALQTVARRNLPIAGQIHVGLGQLQYEWNDLQTAAHHLDLGIRLNEAGGFPIVATRFLLARLWYVRGEVEQAVALAKKARQQMALLGARRLAQARVWQVRFWLAQGDVEAAARWARTVDLLPEETPDLGREADYLSLVRVRLAQDEASSPLVSALQALRQAAITAGRTGSEIEAVTLLALVYNALNEPDAASLTLWDALTLARPAGYMRLFLDEGEPMANLLAHLPEGEEASQLYVKQLLDAFTEEGIRPLSQAQPLAEPLSPRELEILQLIAAGHSNQEIADELVIAISTVKWHIHNVYGKLQVQSRTQAIARASELDILA